MRRLAAAARLGDADSAEVQATATRLVEAVRTAPAGEERDSMHSCASTTCPRRKA